MTNGDCSADKKVSSSRGNSDSGDIQTFTQHERHQSIVRQQLLSKLSVEFVIHSISAVWRKLEPV